MLIASDGGHCEQSVDQNSRITRDLPSDPVKPEASVGVPDHATAPESVSRSDTENGVSAYRKARAQPPMH